MNVNQKQGVLFILVGPGGVGKNTMMNDVMARIPDMKQLATYTTRSMRPGEVQNVHHIFVQPDEFRALIPQNWFIEHEEVHPGKFYGTPRGSVETAFEQGRVLIADIEFMGASRIKAAYPQNTIIVFVKPTSPDVLEARMRQRGEPQEEIDKRMARAVRELQFEDQSDYVIINDELERATQELYELVIAEKQRRSITVPQVAGSQV